MVAPVPFPQSWFSSVSFNLTPFVSQNMLYGGATQSREQADPRWVAKYTTAHLSPTKSRQWKAWWDGLRGGLNKFLAFDPAQEFPLAYLRGFSGVTRAVGGGSFDGTGDVTSIGTNTIGLEDLPASMPIAAGDLIELAQGDKHGLFRITTGLTGGAGGTTTVTVIPRIVPGNFSAGVARYNFYRPSCVMTPNPDSWDHSSQALGPPPGATFTAIQSIY